MNCFQKDILQNLEDSNVTVNEVIKVVGEYANNTYRAEYNAYKALDDLTSSIIDEELAINWALQRLSTKMSPEKLKELVLLLLQQK